MKHVQSLVKVYCPISDYIPHGETHHDYMMCEFCSRFIDGYNAAGAELRSDEASAIDYHHKPVGCSPIEWADWLDREEGEG